MKSGQKLTHALKTQTDPNSYRAIKCRQVWRLPQVTKRFQSIEIKLKSNPACDPHPARLRGSNVELDPNNA
jgi:hypothetical protein